MATGTQDKILIVQPLPGIGDAVWFLSHIFSLKKAFPKAALTLLTKKRSKADEIFAGQNIIKDYIWLERNPGRHSGFDGFFALVNEIKEKKFTSAWILHPSPTYALACKMAGVRRIYGYGKGYGHLFVKSPFLKDEELKEHPIQRATLLLQYHNIPLVDLNKITLKPNRAKLNQLNKNLDLAKYKNIILCIGGSEPFKKWPGEHYKKVAKYFLEHNFRVYILGGPQEQKEADLIVKEIKEETRLNIHAVTHLSIAQAICLISQASLFIGNDTGMLNIAAVVGVPTIGIFGKTPPLTYRNNLRHLVAPEIDGDQKVSNVLPDQAISLSKALLES